MDLDTPFKRVCLLIALAVFIALFAYLLGGIPN